MDAETIYYALRRAAEEHGWVGDHADEKLGEAAQAMADDPQNND